MRFGFFRHIAFAVSLAAAAVINLVDIGIRLFETAWRAFTDRFDWITSALHERMPATSSTLAYAGPRDIDICHESHVSRRSAARKI